VHVRLVFIRCEQRAPPRQRGGCRRGCIGRGTLGGEGPSRRQGEATRAICCGPGWSLVTAEQSELRLTLGDAPGGQKTTSAPLLRLPPIRRRYDLFERLYARMATERATVELCCRGSRQRGLQQPCCRLWKALLTWLWLSRVADLDPPA
jgi:hypothetical protein